MKNIILLTFFILLQPAYSQTALFEGAYYGIGFVSGSTTTKATDTDTGLYDNNGKSMQAASVEVGYGYPYQDNLIINLTATYDLTNPVIHSSADSAYRTDTQKSHFRIGVEPGFLINSKTLVFGKFGLHSNKIHYFREFISGTYSGQTSNATSSFTGYGIGAGIKTELTNNVLIGIDTEVVNYGSKNPFFVRSGGTTSDVSSYRPTSNITTISIKKKF